jgi:hypothetical protein
VPSALIRSGESLLEWQDLPPHPFRATASFPAPGRSKSTPANTAADPSTQGLSPPASPTTQQSGSPHHTRIRSALHTPNCRSTSTRGTASAHRRGGRIGGLGLLGRLVLAMSLPCRPHHWCEVRHPLDHDHDPDLHVLLSRYGTDTPPAVYQLYGAAPGLSRAEMSR